MVTMQLSSMSSFETSHRAKLLQSASLIAYLSCHVVLLGFAFEVAERFRFSFLCSIALPLSLADCPSSTQSHFASALTLAGVPITVQLGPRHQHNGTPKGSTPRNTIVNHISWVFTSAISGFGVNVIIAALPTVELCMNKGE